MNYTTFIYNLFLEPTKAFTYIKENNNIKYIIITLLIILTGLINSYIYLDNYTSSGKLMFVLGINILNIAINYLFLTIIIHSFASFLNYDGNIKTFFSALFLSLTPYILLSSIGLISLLFSSFNFTVIKILLSIWSIYLIFICIKVNYSISLLKSVLIYLLGIVLIVSIIILSFLLSFILIIMNLF